MIINIQTILERILFRIFYSQRLEYSDEGTRTRIMMKKKDENEERKRRRKKKKSMVE